MVWTKVVKIMCQPHGLYLHCSKLIASSVPCQQKSIAQATIDKGHREWDVNLRPIYLDAQVKQLNILNVVLCSDCFLYKISVYTKLD